MVKSHPFLTEKDLEKILNAPINCHPSQRFIINTLIQLLWDSGARISEVTNLKIEDFDPVQKFLTFKNTKNHQDRIVPITESVSKALSRLLRGRRNGYIFKGSR